MRSLYRLITISGINPSASINRLPENMEKTDYNAMIDKK